MTLIEAKEQARKGVKVTHRYFAADEYLTIDKDMIVFEDGSKAQVDDWFKGKPHLLEGWSIYEDKSKPNEKPSNPNLISLNELKEGQEGIIQAWVNQPDYVGDRIKMKRGVVIKIDKKGFKTTNIDKRYPHHYIIKLVSSK